MSDAIVEVRQLAKRFGRRVALADVDLTLGAGRITALVGPNGSGKTTLLKLLAGFLRPTSGAVRVFGMDPYRRRPDVMKEARFAFAPPAWYDSLSARETLAALSGIRAARMARPTRGEIDEALDTVGLADRADDRMGVFSFGMRQRLALAQALLPMPRLLALDEPNDGLDPLGTLELRAVLARLRDEHGVAILLSSHLLIEVQKLADELLLLGEGRPLFRGSPEELIEGGRRLRLTVHGNGNAAQLAADLLRGRGIAGEACDHHLVLPKGAIELGDAQKLLSAAGLVLREFHEESPTLEEAMLERLRTYHREQTPTAERARPSRDGGC